MSIEQRLRDALGPSLSWQDPSPDLFTRVQRSVEEARRRRARNRGLTAGALSVAMAVGGLLAVLGDVRGGRFVLEWWWLEGLVTAALIALVLVLGPLIRRFGRIYATEVFAATPQTGAALLALMDIAYYLIFGAYVMMTTAVVRRPSWSVFVGAEQLWHEAERAGGLLLVMGVLHGLNLAILPVVAHLLALNQRERSPGPPEQHVRMG